MVDLVEFLLSLISLLVHFFQVLRKAFSMALSSKSPSPAPPPLSWKRFSDSPVAKRPKEDVPSESSSVSGSKDLILISKGSPQENLASRWLESIPKGVTFKPEEKCPQGNLCLEINPPQVSLSSPRDCDGKVDLVMRGQKNICERREAAPDDNTVVQMLALDSLSGGMVGKAEMRGKMRKRPAKIAIPESCVSSGFGETSEEKNMVQVFEVEGSEYCLASRKGRRHVMEDGHEVITNISGDSKQAFFGVFDGHGGRAAVDFVSEKLGKNIITALAELEKKEGQLELAIKAGYLTTDREFLSQGVSSGACAATVLLKDGELHVANVGDCRVVMSRKGVANALTIDHRAGREDERTRIENLGGYVGCRNGVWRVQDSLAVSRAIGDMSMKKWIISEPETKKLRLTSDCEFLIIASDGLWDKVTNQEAVDVVLKHKNSIKSCRDLVDISSSRGSRDDITVMVVDLQRFAQCGR